MPAESTPELSINPALLSRKEVASSGAKTETWFRYGLWVVSAIVAVVLLASAGVMLWAQNEFSPAESVISAQSQMLAEHGTMYYDLNHYPYTVTAYMPTFYWLEAGMVRLGLPALLGGRLITFCALLSLIFTVWKVVQLYTDGAGSGSGLGAQHYAWIAAILVASSPLMIFWGVVAQTDILAVCFAMAAFYQYSRFEVQGKSTLLLAGIFAGLALFTKQTMIAVAPAIVLSLWIRGDRKNTIRFSICFGVVMGALVLGMNALLHGRFLAATVFANMNPLSWDKFLVQMQYFGGVSAGMIVIVAASGSQFFRERIAAPGIYLVCSALVFMLTAPKIGSDTNYQLELTAAMAVATAVGLQRLDFLTKYFHGSKSWITLLLLPLGVHVMIGCRVGVNMLITRVANEQMFRAQIESLRPYLDRSEANQVLVCDYNSVARLRGHFDVETFIYSMLVKAKLVDPEPVRRDLANSAFATVILGRDIFGSTLASDDPELNDIPESQLDEIRKHYHLVAHVPGPYLDGLFVYRPVSQSQWQP